jgi:hypothetical protein
MTGNRRGVVLRRVKSGQFRRLKDVRVELMILSAIECDFFESFRLCYNHVFHELF